jgi:hypothetical protein
MDERRSPADGRPTAPSQGADVLGPVLSALIFGYFGFLAGLSTGDASGTVPLYLVTVWVLRVSAILFVAAAVVAMLGIRRATLISGLACAAATLGLLVVMVWSVADQQRDIAIHPLIMAICIAWNGYCAGRAIRDGLR